MVDLDIYFQIPCWTALMLLLDVALSTYEVAVLDLITSWNCRMRNSAITPPIYLTFSYRNGLAHLRVLIRWYVHNFHFHIITKCFCYLHNILRLMWIWNILVCKWACMYIHLHKPDIHEVLIEMVGWVYYVHSLICMILQSDGNIILCVLYLWCFQFGLCKYTWYCVGISSECTLWILSIDPCCHYLMH